MVLAFEVLGGLAVLLVHLNCPVINWLELSLFGAELIVAWRLADFQVSTPSRRDESVNCRSSLKLAPRASMAKPEVVVVLPPARVAQAVGDCR